VSRFFLKNLLPCLIVVFFPVSAYLLLKFANLFCGWASGTPLIEEGNFIFEVTAINAVPIYFVMMVVFLFFNRVLSAFLLGTVSCFTFTGINAAKLTLLDNFFLPTDIVATQQVIGLIPDFWNELAGYLAILTILVIACALSMTWDYKRKPRSKRFLTRFAVLAIGVSGSFVFWNADSEAWSHTYPPRLRSNYIFSKKVQYGKKGAILGFARNMRTMIATDAPEDYNQANIRRIAQKRLNHDTDSQRQESYQKLYSSTHAETAGRQVAEKPSTATINPHEKINLIFYMMEAFWDPLLLEEVGITIEPDPIPFFRSLTAKHPSGQLIVPTFGGMTAKTEFEVISGFANHFFNNLPYYGAISRPFDALPEVLKDAGYHTLAIHPYRKWFWNRSSIYPIIGIDQFIGQKQFGAPSMAGRFIADKAMVDKIIQISEQKSPFFIFGITMSTHGPYDRANNPNNFTINAGNKTFTNNQLDNVNNYLKLINQADQAFKRLVEHFENKQEKTVIVAFGDHLPSMGDMFNDIGYFTNTNAKERFLRKYSTPLLIWSNFGLPRENLFLSANYLAPFTAKLLQIKMPPSYQFANEIIEHVPILSSSPTIRKTYATQTLSPGAINGWVRDYQLVAYDALLGDQILNNIDPKKRSMQKFEKIADSIRTEKSSK
jgi:phosphoglycerol transferase MdoB-like AlkP superfamily enzyme